MAKRNRNGEGTIGQRTDGRWMARYYVTYPDGSRHRQQIIDKDREVVRAKMLEELSKIEQGVPLYRDKTRTLGGMIEYYLEYIAPTQLRVTTLRGNKKILERHVVPNLGHIQLTSLNPEHLRRLLTKMEKDGVGLCTIRKAREAISAVLREAMKLEYVHKNVARLVLPPKKEHKERNVWTSDQVAQFLESCRGHRYYPLFLVMFHTGLRRSEILGVRWQDVDFEKNEIHIRIQRQHLDNEIHILPPKTKSSIRDLPMANIVREELLKQKPEFDKTKHTDDFVFRNSEDRPIDPSSLGQTLRYLAREAGLPYISLHEIRHTVATMLKDQGVSPKDAQTILGHSCIATTLQIYTHTSHENKATAINLVANSILNSAQV